MSTCPSLAFLLLLAAGLSQAEAAIGSTWWDSSFGPYHLRRDEVRDLRSRSSSSSSDSYWGRGWGLHARSGFAKHGAAWSIAHHPQLRLTSHEAKQSQAASTQPGHGTSEAWIVPALSRVMEGRVVAHEERGRASLPLPSIPAQSNSPAASVPVVVMGSAKDQHLAARAAGAAAPVGATTLGEAEEESAEYSAENAQPSDVPEAHDNVQEEFKGGDESVSEVDVETREFEDDMKNAFDLNKITFAQVPLHYWAWWIALVFAFSTCLISGQLIMAHLEKYGDPAMKGFLLVTRLFTEQPDVQKYVVRILFMAPIYAIDAFLSLTFDNAAVRLLE
eukprot:749980-Hanusia_phi.AAC.5